LPLQYGQWGVHCISSKEFIMATGLDLPHLEELLARARNGDREAENELFDYVLKRFEVIVTHIYRVPARADVSRSDVIQEGCLRLVEGLRKGKSELFADARGFLVMSAKHLRWALLDLLRDPKHRHLESLVNPDESQPHYEPSAPARTTSEQLELWTKFHELIDHPGLLTEEERQTLSLRWYHGLSQEEIADKLQVSVRTVKRYWHQAKEKLRNAGLDLTQLC
jgi:RNA polymerase sigma factor (sigma-70 family)